MTFVNPEPLAPFADVIAAGEGEVLVPGAATARSRGARDRDDLLRAARARARLLRPVVLRAAVRGRRHAGRLRACAPAPTRRCRCARPRSRPPKRVDPPATSIFTPDTEFGSRFLVEVVRGCANLCRFCWAGYNYLPVRAVSDRPHPRARRSARARTASRVGLVSIALCDHPDIERILARLIEMGYAISPASLRLDDLTEPIVRVLRESGERTITIAPETGSDRLRRVINKTVTNDEILDRAELIFASGIENLKLYYMIGLPTETDDDLVAIRDLTLQIRERMLKHARAARHDRPHRRQREPADSEARHRLSVAADGRSDASIDRKIKRLRSLTAGIDNVYFNIKSERHSYYQALLSLGDRRVAPAIEAAERNGQNWRAAVAEAGVDADFFIFRDRTQRRRAALGHHRRRHEGAVLPRRVRQGPPRGMDAAAEARSRKTPELLPVIQ